jgi:hypothetical protein
MVKTRKVIQERRIKNRMDKSKRNACKKERKEKRKKRGVL